MARQASIAYHVEDILGTAVISTNPVAGGDASIATRVRLGDGRSVFVKAKPGAPAGFFATEARGLSWLAAAGEGAAATPRVLGYDDECLVLDWVETGRPSADAAERLGRALATTHASGAPAFGAATDGFVGLLPQPNAPAERWPEFYARRRIEPYLRVAFNRGRLDAGDANSICEVLDRLHDLAGPAETPARIHGDLWSGNIIWATDGVPAGGRPRRSRRSPRDRPRDARVVRGTAPRPVVRGVRRDLSTRGRMAYDESACTSSIRCSPTPRSTAGATAAGPVRSPARSSPATTAPARTRRRPEVTPLTACEWR